MTVEMILIRHGLPHRVEGVSKPDPGLTGVGRAQADAVAAALSHETITMVAASNLRRAQETALPTLRTFGLPLTVEPGMAELDTGADYYIPIEDMVAEHDPRLDQWRELVASGDSVPVLEAYRSQVRFAADRLVDRVDDGSAFVVFCHGGTIGACARRAVGPNVKLAEPEYASITRLSIDGDVWLLRSYNEIQHTTRLGSMDHLDTAWHPQHVYTTERG